MVCSNPVTVFQEDTGTARLIHMRKISLQFPKIAPKEATTHKHQLPWKNIISLLIPSPYQGATPEGQPKIGVFN